MENTTIWRGAPDAKWATFDMLSDKSKHECREGLSGRGCGRMAVLPEFCTLAPPTSHCLTLAIEQTRCEDRLELIRTGWQPLLNGPNSV